MNKRYYPGISGIIDQPKVKDVAVIGIPDVKYGEMVVHLVEPKPCIDLTETEMKAFYEPQIPKYDWPRVIVFDKVPRNPTGKIEKPELKERYSNIIWNAKA